MNQVKLIGVLVLSVSLLISCDKESFNMEELEGNWFRSHKNKVWGGHNKPSFERGESHITITFSDNGEFVRNRTVLGIYEGTNINDTSAIVIESGTFTTENDAIEILLNERIWWDSFYEDMDGFEASGIDPNKYKDITYQINGQELKLEYFIQTDIISDEQETPGLDKFEEVFIKLK